MRNIALSLPSFKVEEEEAIVDCLRSGWVMQGPRVAQFEEDFAKYIGAKYALAVTSCTTALHLALMAAGIGEGDEVIVPTFSWVTSANAVEYVRGKVVFVDVDETFNLDIAQLDKLVTEKTKAIIPVHLFGLCVNVSEIRRKYPNLLIVEDAACAAGASFNGSNAGVLGDIAVFSFHPRKSITTGEGGMITTNNEVYYKKLLALRNHGLSPDFVKKNNEDMPEVDVLGYNYRMTDLQGAIGVTQLKRIEQMITERNTGAEIYYKALGNNPSFILPLKGKKIKHSWQSFVVLLTKESGLIRNEVMAKLAKKGIATRPGTQALPMLTYYKNKYQIKDIDYPMATYVYENSIAIPMHNKMSNEDYEYVAEVLGGMVVQKKSLEKTI